MFRLLMWATVMGLLIQMLSTRVGVATGKYLAELCRDEYLNWARLILWFMAEVALIGNDIQEVIGSAIAIHIFTITITRKDEKMVNEAKSSGSALTCAISLSLLSHSVFLFYHKNAPTSITNVLDLSRSFKVLVDVYSESLKTHLNYCRSKIRKVFEWCFYVYQILYFFPHMSVILIVLCARFSSKSYLHVFFLYRYGNMKMAENIDSDEEVEVKKTNVKSTNAKMKKKDLKLVIV
ncbi:uncharacterized protein LOC126673684 [Mercurialis annua]|uniref:uncharacterized protein LOC126673684 n=1 Tax=Mercurialis annua TaxID=3986 RepID=UPI0024ADA8C1|nr:uncharacterized protein LOC126673684 [Mercurialis annua]